MKSIECYPLCKAQCLIEAYSDSTNITELAHCRRWTKCPDYDNQIAAVEDKIKEIEQSQQIDGN